jgi:hypothetical protein
MTDKVFVILLHSNQIGQDDRLLRYTSVKAFRGASCWMNYLIRCFLDGVISDCTLSFSAIMDIKTPDDAVLYG